MSEAGRLPEPLAVIGSSCRLPGGANSPSKLWSLLKEPRDVSVEIPPSRFNPKGFYHSNGEHHGSTNVTRAYLLGEDPRLFDNGFFNINPKEAEAMDPQQRILLETVYEGLESAGCSMNELRGSSTSVFVGQMTDDYYELLLRDLDTAPQYAATGTSRAIMANRISYFFDWKGPSIAIDTACSSSLVALHQAVQTLRSGESQMAVVAGVNLILGPDKFIFESKLHMLSPTGRSRMWDSKADGYARGEGFVSVVIKTLKQALADHDHIECIIRETGVNQDGRTSGLTVPSATSQASLIQSTYQRSGLDSQKIEDRCQYFEAHGTGTLAGDPREAEAIHNTFFSADDTGVADSGSSALYVGSAKTVIGHLEGAAGLVGLLKASLLVQHGEIPPNMHFDELNPAIEPFYKHLRIPTTIQAWPKLSPGVPRRVSVNSFGFGGTNAHAIIESWEDIQVRETSNTISDQPSTPLHGPITLSAHSESSLVGSLTSLSNTLRNSDDIDLENLAWTLQTRRTEFPFKAAFSGDRAELRAKLDAALKMAKDGPQSMLSTKPIHISTAHPLRILGVFTGQGAQWPSMGANLYIRSYGFKRSFQVLQQSLNDLPDAPTWSLIDELLAPVDSSRVQNAEISQPLTTAIQIALVDLLKASGVLFNVVVGHSSGEIAAAYAAGFIEPSDAIRIAYYRGFHSRLVGERQGKMMAAKMTFEEAEKLCQREQFLGRLKVAASNSKSNVTLSGDGDAVDEAKRILDETETFARVLKVDTAYHSHHMEACAPIYLESLRQCKIQNQRVHAKGSCNWYSSVYGSNGGSISDFSALRDTYWVDNLTKPVLFSQALERAIGEEYCLDLALEIGPHPALKGPAMDTIKDDAIAFSDALGFIWKNTYPSTAIPNFNDFRQINQEHPNQPQVQKNLPAYSWNHDKPLFKESRTSRTFRSQDSPIHELLGRATQIGDANEVQWRNILKLDEIRWLEGHRFQDQVVFPAAGYISMAVDAAVRLIKDEPINLVELQDLNILRAITLSKESSGVEVKFLIRTTNRDSSYVSFEFSCYSTDVDGNSRQAEQLHFNGRGVATLGNPDENALPHRRAPGLPMEAVNNNRFYEWMSKCGLDYSGEFVADSIKRRLDLSTVTMKQTAHISVQIHPPTLDTAFHSLFAAFSFPGDDRMRTHYLPTSVRRVRVSMPCPQKDLHYERKFFADCHLLEGSSKEIRGDIDVSCAEDGHMEIQIQDIVCSSFTKSTEENDRKLFARTVWKKDISSGVEAGQSITNPSDVRIYEICERMAFFYLRKLRQGILQEEVPSFQWHFQCLFEWTVNHLLSTAESGGHPRLASAWAEDTYETIMSWKDGYPGRVDIQLIHALGSNISRIVRGELAPLQIMLENDMLNRFYKEGNGLPQANANLGTILGQLSHRYPRLRILEIGAGTGASTAVALKHAGSHFESYTFTDVSPGFFEHAQATFTEYGERIKYEVLDIERSPMDQGFREHSYDVIVASNVLHATARLSTTIQNCRKLLRPGGHMILLELTSETLWTQFIFSVLPGWWLGREDGRIHHPSISEARWHSILEGNGFSGVDHVLRDTEVNSSYTFSTMISQAVDQRVELLREPLNTINNELGGARRLTIIGGQKLSVAKVALKIQRILHLFMEQISIVDSLVAIRPGSLQADCAVIILSDLDKPIFKHLDHKSLHALQLIFNESKYVLWATQGCRNVDPYASMSVGVGRSIMTESPHVRLQFVDVDCLQKNLPEATAFSEALLRMIYLDQPDFQNLLWSKETELAIEDGSVYIPRVISDNILNDRFNSTERVIEKEVCPTSTPVLVSQQDGKLVFEEASHSHHNVGKDDGIVTIKVDLSTSFALSCSDATPIYLCLGSVFGSNRKILAMCNTNCSVTTVPLHATFDWDGMHDDEEALKYILRVLFLENLVAGITGTLWVHVSDVSDVTVLLRISERQGVKLLLSTSSPSPHKISEFIHPRTADRELENIVPHDTQRFANLSDVDSSNLEHFAATRLSNNVEIENRGIGVNKDGGFIYDLRVSYAAIHELLGRSLDLDPLPPSEERRAEAWNVKNIYADPSWTSLINWRDLESVPVRVTPPDVRGILSSEKTYFLVGLTGKVGLSLCEWMIQQGARYFAFASRNPKVDSETVEYLRLKGASIRYYSLDVTDKKALRDVHQEILASMPPIGGVANAAMVLRDKPFSSMSVEEFEIATKPKVEGTRNLDQLFYSTELDFFILFSSMGCVIGNAGQSNYGAANMFMSTLAAQRRKRGLAASVMDIAMLLGFGYLGTQDEWLESHLRKTGYLPICEPVFHTIFTEAIISGRPNSGLDHELITGLGDHPDAPWRGLARFSHCFSQEAAAVHVKDSNQAARNLQSQLSDAQDPAEALSILQASFSVKLGRTLQVPSDEIDMSTPLIGLGIDSLVAVEIRSWFLKEIGVNVPILSILSGATVDDLCQEAVGKLLDLSRKPHAQPPVEYDSEESKNPQDSSSSTAQSTAPSQDGADEVSVSTGLSTPTLNSATSAAVDSIPSDCSSIPLLRDTTYERSGEMSHAQARLYFLHEYLEDKSTYTVAYVGKFHGRLDVVRLQKSLHYIGMKHESLRSSYFVDKESNQALQTVNAKPNITIKHKHITSKAEVRGEIDTLKKFVFEIERGQLMLVVVLTESPTLHHVIFLHHHIALDGLSWNIFLRDLTRAYSGRQLDSCLQQAIDMSDRQKISQQPANLKDELAYWSCIHQDHKHPLPLFPFAKTKARRMLTVYDTETFSIELDAKLAGMVKQQASALRVTSFHFHLSSLAIFLARCLNTSDFSIGIVDANRTEQEDQDTIGYFLNMLPLRFQLALDESFRELAQRTRQGVFEALTNSRVPFDMILDNLEGARSGNHHPIFQVAMNYRMGYASQTPMENGKFEWTGAIYARNPYDLVVDVTENSDRTLLFFTTQKYLYRASDTKLLMNWYTRVLEGLVENPSSRVSDCPISNELDTKHAAALGNGKSMTVEWDGTLIHRVERMADETPDSIAVKDEYGHTYTYSKMMARTHHISNRLQHSSAPLGSRVAMLLNPTADAVCCLISVLRLGFAWIPLDLRNPIDRLSVIVSESRPQILICNNETAAQAQQLATEIDIVNIDDPSPSDRSDSKNISVPDQPAVVLYTSGSTGTPKGAILTHSNLLNQVFCNAALFSVRKEVVLQQSSLGFDMALDQIFQALANGGTLIIVGKEGRGNPTHIAELMLSENITYTHFVPSEYQSLLHYGSHILEKCCSWRFAFSGGEKVNQELLRAFRKLSLSDLQLINVYGPTECTISIARGIIPYQNEDASIHGDSLWTLPNYSILIVDAQMNPLPVGFPGEICVSGAGIGLGYLNRVEETERKFIEMSQVSQSSDAKSGTRLYRTGDLGRILEDGSLELLGRLEGDSQVKIHGIRIELDEISSTIINAADGAIDNAAVSSRQDQILAAFVVFSPQYSGDKFEFANQLKANLPLPPYMCPSYIIPVDSIPTNANGKKDKGAIDEIPLPIEEEVVISDNLSPQELKMKEVWEEVLAHRIPTPRLDVDSDFFHAGGNSLLLIKLRSVIRGALGVAVSLPELFRSSTLRSMSALVEIGSQDAPNLTIDWNNEVTGLCHGLPQPNRKIPPKTQSGKVILLTGATGFLGTRILKRLVVDENVRKIHCLAIRPDEFGRPRHVAIGSEKIVEHSGSLSDRFLGLSKAQFRSLGNEIDLIIHNGAEVSLLKTYQSLRRVNAVSTKALCELAIPRQIPFHFVSTATVARFAGQQTVSEVSMSKFVPPSNTADGYGASKWVSEAVLERAAAHHALPVWIHRPTGIVGDGAPELDWITALFKYSQILRAVPSLSEEYIIGSFDFIGVEDATRELVERALSSRQPKEQNPAASFVHHCSATKVAPSALGSYIEELAGEKFSTFSLKEWLDAARAKGLEQVMYDFLLDAFGEGKKVILPMITK
ncbi:hybrid PKS-NRPS PsoA [Hypoxylon trugodes]|uniref:hybrid PKS-NRPS PsoA n=1 Tax=Hypoxylon trugodes TaxID=326681 RepID=UPI00219C1DB5|nr:hybrid PKS-NRPS PsoA [Hypoxylon trugodes]KAI1392616.1 hybrid PKS-NRPS PsoA [Hypoxylon trugodes]